MPQNGQTDFKNLAAFDARFLKCAWSFWKICSANQWTGFYMITASAMKGLKKNPFSYLLKVLDKNIDHINLLSAAGLSLVYGIVAVTMMRYNNNSIIRY